MNIEPLLHNAAIVANILADSLVLVFSFAGYRRTQMRAFAFLIGGSTIGIILILWSNLAMPSPTLYPDEYQEFIEFYYVGSIASVGLWAIGIVLLIRRVQAMFERKTPPNTAPDSK
jgi:hypothetical protein